MDAEIEQLLQNYENHHFVDPRSIKRLCEEAEKCRNATPSDSLRIWRTVARVLYTWRAASTEEKLHAFQMASVLGQEIGEPLTYFDLNAAKLFAAQGDHASAGYFFQQAARTWEKEAYA